MKSTTTAMLLASILTVILLVSIVFLFPKNNKMNTPAISASPTAASGEQSGESGQIAQSVIDTAMAKAQEICAVAENLRIPLEEAKASPDKKSDEIVGTSIIITLKNLKEQKTSELIYNDSKLTGISVRDTEGNGLLINYNEWGIGKYTEFQKGKVSGCIMFFHKNLQLEYFVSMKDNFYFGPYFRMDENGDITQSGEYTTPTAVQFISS